jgi:hypothetical protein
MASSGDRVSIFLDAASFMKASLSFLQVRAAG